MDQTPQTAFRQGLKEAARRYGAGLALDALAVAAAAGAVLVGVLLLCERLLAVRLLAGAVVAAVAGAAGLYVLARWWLARPTPMQAAMMLDERLTLKERFSTTLAVRDLVDPFADAVREDAYARAREVNVRTHFPIRLSRRWMYAAGAWSVVAAVALWMPQFDLLDRREAARLAEAQERRLEQSRTTVRQTIDKVETLVKQLDLPELSGDLASLGPLPPGAAPAEVRRDAIRKLGDLGERLRQAQQGEQAEAARLLQRMLRQLKTPGQGVSAELARTLARGDFGKAAELLRALREQMERGNLSPEDREKLAKALEALAKQLDSAADRRKELEDALERAGAERDLAKLGESDLRRALDQYGLDAATVRKLMDKARAARAASGQCKSLGQSLAGCSSGLPGADALSADALMAAAEQLDDLEALRQQLALMGATLDEIQAGMELLGQGQLARLGAMGVFDTDGLDEPGAGSGRRGQGSGPVETAPDGQTKSFGSRVMNPAGKPEPIIATWYTQEEQVKGEATRRVQETVEAARDRAAEAVSENRIPSKYHGAVKQYFGDLKPPGEGP